MTVFPGRPWLAPLLAAGAALAAALLFSPGPGLTLDDAYIHLVFARNLAAGQGFSFNAGEFSLGFSSPLWVLLLALSARLGADLPLAARLLACAAFSLAAALFSLLVRSALLPEKNAHPSWNRANRFGLAAGLFMAASGNLLWLAVSGMESMLFLMLGLAALLLHTRQHPRPWASGTVLGLLLLTRLEGLALWGILGIHALGRGRRRTLPALPLSLAVAAPWFLFSLFKTGRLLPPTSAGKLASDLFNAGLAPKAMALYLWNHLLYLLRYNPDLSLLAGLGLAAACAAVLLRRTAGGKTPPEIRPLASLSLLLLWAAANLLLHAALFRSTAIVTPYHNLRYHIMLLPALLGLGLIPPARAAKRLRRPLADRILGAVLLIVFLFSLGRCREWKNFCAANQTQLQSEHRPAALWAREALPENARLACLDIGMLGYYSGRYIIDLGGLIDPEIHPLLKAHRTGPYLARKKATHYLAMVRHDSERITGVKKDAGRLYRLRFLRRFDFPPYRQPVFIHSLGLEVYEVLPLSPAP